MGKHFYRYWRVVLTGYVQVLLVVVNTWMIAHNKYGAAIFVGFFISLVWTLNVKSVTVGTWGERIMYSLAATAGTATGLLIPHLIYT